MPAQKNFSVKRVFDLTPATSVINGFAMKHVRFNLVIVEKEDEKKEEMRKLIFATNLDFNENDVNLADRLLFMYSKRWGIETGYRVKKHSFRGKTTSKNYRIRLFYFMFSVLMYNLWILADILIWLHLYGDVGEGHLLTSKYFGTLIIAIDPGG